MSGQRARPSVAADNRSAHPNIPGVPWWGAVLIAVVASAAGFAVDAGSGNGELTAVFATLFALGCLAAVLAVRRNGLFTAVIQPPLILFVVVPGAYFLMHRDSIEGLKDILINCGYPLIERFPLMFFTSAAVLLIGLARWYLGQASGQASGQSASRDDTGTASRPARGATAKAGRLPAMVAAVFGGRSAATATAAKAATTAKATGDEAPPRRRRQQDRRSASAQRSASRSARGDRQRSKPAARRPRPDETDIIEQVATDRPRRRRPRPEDAPPPDQRRRTRSTSAREPRRAAPDNDRRVPYDRAERGDRERPPQRRSRYNGYEGYETFGGYDRYDRPDLGYEPRREPPQQRGNGTHHPVSRVRYRGAEDADERVEHRRRARGNDADRWEYDI
ncbi:MULTISPECIES: DUF6542 domain-containing protein [Mycolicibacterium]|uniref:DUF6542 domain-containing protein n=1 Tax=Mycolicibacterium TaxID=1866885 RepID=UPI001EF54561|nr:MULTISPECIES: DUF6542 domain-containing protein [Mycolicibacterium]MCG7582654.1 hypothetical protein [Mycolicibacterium sp. OfavD-34-C]